MAQVQKFRVEELDDLSREYLVQARDFRGHGMPGLYFSKTSVLAIIAFFGGVGILVATAIVAFPPLDEPLASAMLQTAGLLMGGWCVFTALRLWGVIGSSTNLGRFLYVDADHVWDVYNSYVEVVSIENLTFVDAEHHNQNGQYQKTEFMLQTPSGQWKFTHTNATEAERLYAFLNILIGIRSQHQEGSGEHRKPQSSAVDAGLALAIVAGVNAQSADAQDLGLRVSSIPQPQKTNPAGSGMVACMVIVALAVVSVVTFKFLNVGWRDDAVFTRIQEIPHQPARAPWLRAYLADPRNVRHRDEAQRELDSIYTAALDRMRNSNEAINQNGRVEFQPAIDPALHSAFATLINELKTRPQPVISIRVAAKDEQNQATHIENQVHTAIFSKFESAMGKELVLFLKAPEEIPGLIEFHWKVEQVQAIRTTLRWTIAFRKTPDAEATVFEYRTNHDNAQAPVTQAMEGADVLMRRIVGTSMAPVPPPDIDF